MRFFICVAAGVALVGCSGGGGGGSGGGSSSGANFSGAQELQPGQPIPDESVSARGIAVQAEFGTSGTVGAFSNPQSAQIVSSSSTTGDGPDAVRFTAGGETVEIDFRNVTEDGLINGAVIAESDSDGSFALSVDGEEPEFAVFGGWAQLPGDDSDPAPGTKINFGAFGAPTPEASMPSGDATYTGRSVGLASDGIDTAIVTSDVTITTQDYNSVQFRTRNTALEIVAGRRPGAIGGVDAAPGLDITATGTVSGNGFTANGAFAGVGDGAGSVRADGSFYGPAAEEAAGTFNGSLPTGSDDSDGARTINYGGAFGARQ